MLKNNTNIKYFKRFCKKYRLLAVLAVSSLVLVLFTDGDHRMFQAHFSQEIKPSYGEQRMSFADAAPRVISPVQTPPTQSPVTSRPAVAVANIQSAPESTHKAAFVLPEAAFPSLVHTVHPVLRVPQWGAMRSPSEWEQTYDELEDGELVAVPEYNLSLLQEPLFLLIKDREANKDALTAKLYYSTRFFGAYDLDAGEYTGTHPGVDLKLAMGTPVGAIGGGRVQYVGAGGRLGTHVVIEHRLQDGRVVFSIYAHLSIALVQEGEEVAPGTAIGRVGMTGHTTAAHLHLQVDLKQPAETGLHVPYMPASLPTRSEIAKHTLHPLVFIAQYSTGE